MSEKQSNLIIFDLDGTLLNDYERFISTYKEAFDKIGLSRDLTPLLSLKKAGKTENEILQLLNVPTEKFEIIHQIRLDLFESQDFLKKQFVFQDTVEVLSKLSQNFILCLATYRRNKTNLLKQLKELELIQYFDMILCRMDFDSKKDMINNILSKYRHLNIQMRYFVTDAVKEIESILDLKEIQTLSISHGLDSKSRLEAVSSFSFDTLSEILQYFQNQNS